ncbi:MAG TPA: hypothetical protein VLI69_03120 [Gammaproteobacteria bacterium]|nr:hypothetical protein [Gammaproteobacteria bacterium]
MENAIEVITKVYILGCLFSGTQSIYKFIKMLSSQAKSGINIYGLHPGIKPWLIKRVIYWPYYLFFKTNPIVLLSELFFSHYGDKEHIYYGTTGLKNFFNDIFKGKNRYKNYKIFATTISLCPSFTNKESDENSRTFYPKYAGIILAKYSDTYLFKSILATDRKFAEPRISRFELDSCRKLTKEEVFASLDEMNPNTSKNIIEKVN